MNISKDHLILRNCQHHFELEMGNKTCNVCNIDIICKSNNSVAIIHHISPTCCRMHLWIVSMSLGLLKLDMKPN